MVVDHLLTVVDHLLTVVHLLVKVVHLLVMVVELLVMVVELLVNMVVHLIINNFMVVLHQEDSKIDNHTIAECMIDLILEDIIGDQQHRHRDLTYM